MKTLDEMTAKEFITRLSSNAWKWDLIQFAEKTGLNADDKWTEETFVRFNRLILVLNTFDPEFLARLAQ